MFIAQVDEIEKTILSLLLEIVNFVLILPVGNPRERVPVAVEERRQPNEIRVSSGVGRIRWLPDQLRDESLLWQALNHGQSEAEGLTVLEIIP